MDDLARRSGNKEKNEAFMEELSNSVADKIGMESSTVVDSKFNDKDVSRSVGSTLREVAL